MINETERQASYLNNNTLIPASPFNPIAEVSAENGEMVVRESNLEEIKSEFYEKAAILQEDREKNKTQK
jgi:hypothetical protein